MRSRSASPHRQVVPHRSPPRQPRNYIKSPPVPSSPAQSHLSQGQSGQTIDSKEPEAPQVPYLPVIPKYDPTPSYTASYEAEIARIEAHRAHLVADYAQVAKMTKRALHELELASIELRAAQGRREIAEAHRKKANLGVLGIDAEPIP
ncbi:hypothetical protein BJ138DRAFT_1004852 [Hygrophoropsis aurantiaca]|uniref:Uncharacterized protein n=1 Tax=Hygrophoropsis aurantiaca TaxID=72124 RepID=A0ACB8AFX5_9AGAM|nr:hypothetical protein BJ138DRAFT_1004852 [Hygrophoropsis aurantiaca]